MCVTTRVSEVVRMSGVCENIRDNMSVSESTGMTMIGSTSYVMG